MSKITAEHLGRSAIVYIRQSTSYQVANNLESQRRQYALVERGRLLGWNDVQVIDDDLGRSGGGIARPGFEKLLGLWSDRHRALCLARRDLALRSAPSGVHQQHTAGHTKALVEPVAVHEQLRAVPAKRPHNTSSAPPAAAVRSECSAYAPGSPRRVTPRLRTKTRARYQFSTRTASTGALRSGHCAGVS
jgi:hypothetical protein